MQPIKRLNSAYRYFIVTCRKYESIGGTHHEPIQGVREKTFGVAVDYKATSGAIYNAITETIRQDNHQGWAIIYIKELTSCIDEIEGES